jgi:prepilin-type N-terminal cleavage/methylation domain-containing protein
MKRTTRRSRTLREPLSRAATRGAGQEGLTLTETLVAIALCGILSSITVSSVGRLSPSYVLRGASTRVYSDFQKARVSAMSENNHYVVTLVDQYTYTILDDRNNDGSANSGEPLTTVDLRTEWPGVTLSASGPTTFLSSGSASTSVTMTITNSKGARSLTVSSGGRIRLSPV